VPSPDRNEEVWAFDPGDVRRLARLYRQKGDQEFRDHKGIVYLSEAAASKRYEVPRPTLYQRALDKTIKWKKVRFRVTRNRYRVIRVYLEDDVAAFAEQHFGHAKASKPLVFTRSDGRYHNPASAVKHYPGFNRTTLKRWAGKKGCPWLGGRRLKKIKPTPLTVAYLEADLDAIWNALHARQQVDTAQWATYQQAKQQFGIESWILSDWRQRGCPHLPGGRPLDAKRFRRKCGRPMQEVWHYSRADLLSIRASMAREADGQPTAAPSKPPVVAHEVQLSAAMDGNRNEAVPAAIASSDAPIRSKAPEKGATLDMSDYLPQKAPQDIARHFGCTVKTLMKHIRDGKIRAVRITSKAYRVHKADWGVDAASRTQ
jgi:hypothetical protein